MPKTKTPKTAARVYRAASYARLSVDDESYGTSGSVLNQHAMIRDFADANGGLSIVAEYSDDGFSGSTFENRPGWGSLLADVETGKVDCIVVKDLSRLGRNYLDVSRYLDQVFPALGVRVSYAGECSIEEAVSRYLAARENVRDVIGDGPA